MATIFIFGSINCLRLYNILNKLYFSLDGKKMVKIAVYDGMNLRHSENVIA